MKKACDPEALRAVFDASPMSQRALARAAMCSRMTPSRLLAGRAVTDEAASNIARVLGRPLRELFADVVSNDEQSLGKEVAA